MDGRIKELAEHCGFKSNPNIYDRNQSFDIQKFAELIIRECTTICDQAAKESARTFYTVSETKEFGPALVAKGSQVQAEKLANSIKQHFGVE